jgi:serine O-acetyltransferase
MSDTIERIAKHLEAQRETDDPISQARRERSVDEARVVEALRHLSQILFDQTPSSQLNVEIHVAHGLVASLVGLDKASRLVEQLPDIRHCIALDLDAAFQRDPAARSYSEIIAAYPSTRAVATFRIAHAFYSMDEPVVARVMSERAHSMTGIDIHPGARIGCHFFIDHGTGVVIGETCEIGNRVKLYHGVTLGAFSNRGGRSDVGLKRHPSIEDDVTIYPNATILGGKTVIGAGSVIGGNAWLTHSVPPNSRVVIEPPKLQLRRNGAVASEPGTGYEF